MEQQGLVPCVAKYALCALACLDTESHNVIARILHICLPYANLVWLWTKLYLLLHENLLSSYVP